MSSRSVKLPDSVQTAPEAVGIREFRSKLPEYVTGTRTIEVQRHGKPVAVVVPVHQARTPQERRALLQAAADAFERVRTALNLSEDELAALIGGQVADGKAN